MKSKSNRVRQAMFCTVIAAGLVRLASSEERVAFQLANGLRVRLVPEKEQDSVVVILGTRAGMLNEPKGKPHVAHVVEHAAVFDMRSAQLAETAHQWFSQAKVNGETLGELMYFDMHVSRQELPTALAIQAARLGDMSFSETTLKREIPRTLGEVEQLVGRPDAMGKFALIPFVQGALHGETNVPFRRSTRQISTEDLRMFHGQRFGSDSTILCVIGDFDLAKTREEIQKQFGSIVRPMQALPSRPVPQPGFQRVTWDVPKRHFWLAWSVPRADEDDHPALLLASMILQQRLFEQHQAKSIPVLPLVNYDCDGILLVGCEVDSEEAFPAARKAIMTEVNRLAQEGGLTEDELRSAALDIEQLLRPQELLDRGALPAGVSRTLACANLELQRMRHELIVGDLDRYAARLKGVEPSAGRRAVAKWLATDKVLAVRVVPGSTSGK